MVFKGIALVLRRRSGVLAELPLVLPVSIKFSSARLLSPETAPGNEKSTCGGSLTGSGGINEAFDCDVSSGVACATLVCEEVCEAVRSAAAILQTARRSFTCCSSSLRKTRGDQTLSTRTRLRRLLPSERRVLQHRRVLVHFRLKTRDFAAKRAQR